MSLMFNRIEGPIDEQMCALLQYTPFAPEGLFASIDLCKHEKENKGRALHKNSPHCQ